MEREDAVSGAEHAAAQPAQAMGHAEAAAASAATRQAGVDAQERLAGNAARMLAAGETAAGQRLQRVAMSALTLAALAPCGATHDVETLAAILSVYAVVAAKEA
ncbi:hypothetical protein [Mycobacterium kansasii]|uniref:hypothetical protein n=1 Tax=Mycobacterium kansasii TaxID=1768 RepID=UPI0021564B3C|nr:hypothetical protein [Mycobacterium kansasii]